MSFGMMNVSLTSSTCWGFQFCGRTQRLLIGVFLEEEPGTTPRLHCCFLTVPSWSLHPLTSMISNCLHLPFGTHGKSRKLNEGYFLKKKKKWGTEKNLLPSLKPHKVLLCFSVNQKYFGSSKDSGGGRRLD